MDVTLEESFTGVKKQIKVPRNEFCSPCQGTGAKSGTSMKTCPTCHGQGQVIMSTGFFRMAQTCSNCGGQGKIITEPCPECRGRGVQRITRTIDVTIPPGVDNDTRMRVKGEGEVGSAGPGDLYIYIGVRPHENFERQGKDLYIQQGVNFTIAALGGEVSVPTLSEHVAMKIPAGTQSGKVFRLKGKGMPDLHNGAPGDLYARVMIQVPDRLTAEQKKLLEEFARLSGETVSRNDSFSEKIKSVFK